MRLLPLACLAAFLPAACSSGRADPAAGGSGAARHASLEEAMEEVIQPAFEDVLLAQLRRTDAELDHPAMAAAARRAGEALARLHGPLALEWVPGFAERARAAEAWMAQVAALADARAGASLRELVRSGEREHCDACHKAHDDAKKVRRRT